jgi:hypothetical protein
MTDLIAPDETRASVEQLADRLPRVATAVRVALETKDQDGMGRMWARRLAFIAKRTEQLCQQWERERQASKTS